MTVFTDEQQSSKDWILNNDGILLIEAGAGTGKSFMSKEIVKALKPKSGYYTAFNKAIVEEGVNRFKGYNVTPKTFHALAYKYFSPELKIEDFAYTSINEHITYADKRLVIDAMDSFFVSASTSMSDYFEEYFKSHRNKEKMCDICQNYVLSMNIQKIPPTFNFMLKYLHLLLKDNPGLICVDLLILDEINDVTAVSLEIFKLINAPKKLGLGESNQAIYEFLNLVNGFEELKNEATIMKYTQSYRCSKEIASKIDKKMKSVLNKDFDFKGTNDPVANGKTLYCTATNSAIVSEIENRLSLNKGFNLLRKPSEIFAAPLALLSASTGKTPYQKKYKFLVDAFEDYKDQSKHKTYFKFLTEEVNDTEINNAVNVLMALKSKNVNLFDLYKKAKEAPKDNDFTIATVFTSKGLEFERVYICDDLNRQFKKALTGELLEKESLTVKRCYYVACSRAGRLLLNHIL